MTNVNKFDMTNVGERLKQERERLDLTQRQVSELAGITQTTHSRYENGERVPTLEAVFGFHQLGFDVVYLLTGERACPPSDDTLTPHEREWLTLYRQSNDKVTLLKLAKSFESL